MDALNVNNKVKTCRVDMFRRDGATDRQERDALTLFAFLTNSHLILLLDPRRADVYLRFKVMNRSRGTNLNTRTCLIQPSGFAFTFLWPPATVHLHSVTMSQTRCVLLLWPSRRYAALHLLLSFAHRNTFLIRSAHLRMRIGQ